MSHLPLLIADSFYDDVLLELLVAVGGALFVGNLMALIRRRAGAPHRSESDLAEAPLGRTVVYLTIGLVVMVWGVASLVAG